MLAYYKTEHPDVKVRSHLSEKWVTPSDRFVCDEGVPQDVIDALRRGGSLITGFVRVKDSFGDRLYDQLIRENTPNLLTIGLTDEQSIPRIVYKGEEIIGRIAVDFEWRTKDADQCGSTYYRIKHTKDSTGALVVETKELAVGERAYGA
ncbi:oxidoreductase [Bacillus subtilis]